MRREQSLRRRLHTLATLEEAVSAMRSLSAHHFRLTRQALPAARAYREHIERALGEVGVSQDMGVTAPRGILLIVSDLGLCSDYNTRLVRTAIKKCHQPGDSLLYCVGRRSRAILTKYGVAPRRLYHAPASVDGLPSLLLQLAQDMLDDFLRGEIGGLFVVSAQFEGAGRFLPTVTQVLPVESTRPPAVLRRTTYQSYHRLAAVAVREYLYTTLHELLLDALASEHGMRLLATESARQWLNDTADTVRRRLSACRREATTQELLDIAAGARARQRDSKQPTTPHRPKRPSTRKISAQQGAEGRFS